MYGHKFNIFIELPHTANYKQNNLFYKQTPQISLSEKISFVICLYLKTRVVDLFLGISQNLSVPSDLNPRQVNKNNAIDLKNSVVCYII